MYKLVIVRHGESVWNQENRFTGWKDVPLSEKGHMEATEAGRLLLKEGFEFDEVFTSCLKRAIETMWHILRESNQMWLPVTHSWKINERHYGALQGLNKSETTVKYGEEQVNIWRRSYDTPPPELSLDDDRHPGKDRCYANLDSKDLPVAESLKDTIKRVVDFWEDQIVPQVRSNKKVLIVAHGNSLRALIKYLEGMTSEEILQVNIPTGTPFVYELDENLKYIQKYYLGNPEEINIAMQAVANQSKKK